MVDAFAYSPEAQSRWICGAASLLSATVRLPEPAAFSRVRAGPLGLPGGGAGGVAEEIQNGNAFSAGKPSLHRKYMEIIDLLRSHAGEIKARFAVKRIGLFGSYARGEHKASSDIDILVEFEKPTFRNFMDLSFYLEDLFGREVYLVTVRGLHSRIRPYVEKDVIWSE